MALVSGGLLWVTHRRDYYDYLLYPKLKAADSYSYPQLRYTVFDVVLLLWCLIGLVASGLSLRTVVVSWSIAGWAYRTIVVYVGLFPALFLLGVSMVIVRNLGY